MRVARASEALDRVRDGADRDGVADLRKSLRKLGTTMTTYSRAFPEEQWSLMRDQAADVFRPAAELRDVDIQLDRFRTIREEAPPQARPGIDYLIEDLESRETGIALTVKRAVDAFSATNVLQQVSSLVETATGIVGLGLDGEEVDDDRGSDIAGEDSGDYFEADFDAIDDEVVDGDEGSDVGDVDATDDGEPADYDYDMPRDGAAHEHIGDGSNVLDDLALEIEVENEAGDVLDDSGDGIALSAQAARVRDLAGRALTKRFGQLDRTLGSTIDAMSQPLSTDRLSAATGELVRQVSIGARRLRYTTDIFTPVFGRPLERVSRELDDLQDVLGEIHDGDVIEGTVLEHLGDRPPTDQRVAGMLYVLAEVRARRAIAQARLERDWTPDRVSGLQKRLTRATR